MLTFESPILKRRAVFMNYSEPFVKKRLIQDIKQFLKGGIIEEVTHLKDSQEMINLFFPVPKKDKNQLRWILDLKFVSQHVKRKPFKLETVKEIREMIHPGDWMISTDVTDAFYHILVNKKFRKLLRFMIGKRKFQYRALPMGLASSPWALTRVMGEFVRKIRSQGIKLSCYMDDIILIASSEEECLNHRDEVLKKMEMLGITVNLKKSKLTPTRKLEHLGFLFDSKKNRICTTASTRRKIVRQASQEPRSTSASISQLIRVNQPRDISHATADMAKEVT